MSRSYPIYISDLDSTSNKAIPDNYDVTGTDNFPSDAFIKVASQDSRYKDDDLNDMKNYYESDIDLDWIIQISNQSEPIGSVGFTNRLDSGYSELNMVAIDDAYPEALEAIMNVTEIN